jgi:hypothetical protein
MDLSKRIDPIKDIDYLISGEQLRLLRDISHKLYMGNRLDALAQRDLAQKVHLLIDAVTQLPAVASLLGGQEGER